MSEIPRKDSNFKEDGRFASRLKMLRDREGWTQNDLARQLNRLGLHYTDSAVGTWEQGGRIPPMDTINALADLFNVDINFLLGKTNKTTMLLTESDQPYTSCAVVSSEETVIIEYVRNLTPSQRRTLRRLLQNPTIHPEMWQLLEQEMDLLEYPQAGRITIK